MNSLGSALRIIRAWRGETSLRVAVLAEVGHYSRIESGKAGVSPEAMTRIAKVLRTTPEKIISLASKLAAGTWEP